MKIVPVFKNRVTHLCILNLGKDGAEWTFYSQTVFSRSRKDRLNKSMFEFQSGYGRFEE